MSKHSILIGAGWMALAALMLASITALAKTAGQTAPVGMIFFFQFAIPLLLVSPLVLNRGVQALYTARPLLHLIRGTFACTSWYLYLFALKSISIVDATLLFNTAPLFVPLVALIWTRHRVGLPLWFGIIAGFVGISLVLHPANAHIEWGTFLALGSGLCAAVVFMAVRLLSGTETAALMMFYYFLIATVASLPLAIAQWNDLPGSTYLILFSIGLLNAFYNVFLILALRRGPAYILSPLAYLAIVFSALIQWIFWNQQPDSLTYAGAILVVLGGIWIVYMGHREHTAGMK